VWRCMLRCAQRVKAMHEQRAATMFTWLEQ
jgi:hypothetical protein